MVGNRPLKIHRTWKEYFNKQDLTESDILSTLIREDKIAICGYSFVRILQGIRDQDILRNFSRVFFLYRI